MGIGSGVGFGAGGPEPAHLAFIPDSDLDAAVSNATIEGEALSALQKGQMNYFIKFLREVMNRAGAPPPGAAASGTPLAAPPPEAEKRNDEYLAWKKKSNAQLEKESGDRAEVREIQGSMLLQELRFK